MTTTDCEIALKNVSVSYGRNHVLRNVSLVFNTQESVAFMGPSGSGKTTLLAVMGGIQKPTSGTVEYRCGGVPVESLHIAWITQTTNALARRTALENVAVGALSTGRKWSEAVAMADVHLEQVGLASVSASQARYLSGGELQRLVIARALIAGAQFIIADEPTGQLDQGTSIEILAVLHASSHGRGLLIATHDPLAADICSRQYTIIDGRVTALD